MPGIGVLKAPVAFESEVLHRERVESRERNKLMEGRFKLLLVRMISFRKPANVGKS